MFVRYVCLFEQYRLHYHQKMDDDLHAALDPAWIKAEVPIVITFISLSNCTLYAQSIVQRIASTKPLDADADAARLSLGDPQLYLLADAAATATAAAAIRRPHSLPSESAAPATTEVVGRPDAPTLLRSHIFQYFSLSAISPRICHFADLFSKCPD